MHSRVFLWTRHYYSPVKIVILGNGQWRVSEQLKFFLSWIPICNHINGRRNCVKRSDLGWTLHMWTIAVQGPFGSVSILMKVISFANHWFGVNEDVCGATVSHCFHKFSPLKVNLLYLVLGSEIFGFLPFCDSFLFVILLESAILFSLNKDRSFFCICVPYMHISHEYLINIPVSFCCGSRGFSVLSY